MPRIRTIKPEFWDDETVGTISRDARLAFIACWNFADDSGRLRWTPAYIKASAFMYDDDLSTADVALIMAELVRANLVVAYEGNRPGKTLAFIPKFSKHQRIDRPGESKFPAPPADLEPVQGTFDDLLEAENSNVRRLFVESSSSPRRILDESSTQEREKEREKEREREAPKSRAKRATSLPADFSVDDDMRAWAKARHPYVDLEQQTEAFKDWNLAKGNTYKDWRAAWRTWISRSRPTLTAATVNGTAARKDWDH